MVFDRSKFKKAKIDEIDDSVKVAQASMKLPGFNGDYARFFSMKDPGKYWFRILPSITGKPYVPCKTVKLPIECPVYDKDGNDTGKKEIRTKDVFTSDVHSKAMQGKSATLTYIEYVYNLASEIQDKDERSKFLFPINGYRTGQGKWVWGVSPMLNYVAYVALYPFSNNDIYRLNLQPKWWDRMKEISIEKSSDDVLSIDVFSDPEEGYPLVINFTMENGKRNYTLDPASPAKGQSWDDFFDKTTVPDGVLDNLSKLPSLDDLYIDVYSRKEWDLEMEGLQRLDEQTGYNIFSNEQFLDELEAMEKLVPDTKAVPAKEEKPAPKSAQRTQQAAPSRKEETAEKQYPPMIKMKKELEAYIEREYEGTEVLPTLPLVELRKWYDLMKEDQILPFEDYKTTDEEADPSEDLPLEETGEEESQQDSPVNSTASTSPAVESSRERLKRLREEAAKRGRR